MWLKVKAYLSDVTGTDGKKKDKNMKELLSWIHLLEESDLNKMI